jgi:ATP-dependent helicase/nuclease subunit A
MPSPRPLTDDRLTPAQREAVVARGNVLVMAGAGTGKTHTLVERCLHCLCAEQPPASLEEILVVTFTEAAAAEMRQRLREQLEEKLRADPGEARWTEQLALFDTAHIGTLHSFCLKLVREHFHELGLDPQLAVLDEGEARLLADEILEAELQDQYAGHSGPAEAVRTLIRIYGGGRDQNIRRLVLRLHHYAQTRPDADGWLARQIEKFAAPAPDEWLAWLLAAIYDWRNEWLQVLEKSGAPGTAPARSEGPSSHAAAVPGAPPTNEKAAELADILRRLPETFSRATASEVLEQLVAADGNWPAKRKTVLRQPLEKFFADAGFLASLATIKAGNDPLAEDWAWVRGHMDALLRLTQRFSARFSARKREDGVLDFHDLEQFALKLLWDFGAGRPATLAGRWRQKIRFVFVDEYQDINAAQDKIIQALSRDSFVVPPSGGSGRQRDGNRPKPPEGGTTNGGNRFLVGDVKQSIYRFRLADPEIFRNYARSWSGQDGQTIPLAENFRGREGLLAFVNSLFTLLLREEVGGVRYDAGARLQFGAPEQRVALSISQDPSPRATLLLQLKSGRNDPEADDGRGENDLSDLQDTEIEARLLACQFKELEAGKYEIWDGAKKGFRPVGWRDMAVLLRAPAGKAEIFAKEFQRAGVPLVVERGGFYDCSEILDLLSLLQLLDNPLQDVPAIAVLRSPLVGLSLDELARVRLAAPGHFWTALNRWREGVRDGGIAPGPETAAETFPRVDGFLNNFSRWRRQARRGSLSQCLETVLAETLYADWLATRPRGAQRRANVERLLGLAQKFDQFQRQGLFRFLKFIAAQREAGTRPDVAAVADEDAVRLMSIHQSKGLEFPVVAVADLAKPFNTQDLRGEIIFDGAYGLCPRIQPPHTGRRYPSLPYWLAQSHQRREQWGEELRLLYVALTRARDTLILTGTIPEKKWERFHAPPEAVTTRAIVAANSYADWLGLWFRNQNPKAEGPDLKQGELPQLRWRIAEVSGLADEPADVAVKIEPPALDDPTEQKLRKVLTWKYPFAAATRRAAKSSVSALRHQAADERDDEAAPSFPAPDFAPSTRRDLRGGLSAADAGTAHHKFLQHVALENAASVPALKLEAERLEQEKILSAAERAALNLEDIAAFWDSPPGKKIRAEAAKVRRELAFTARFSPAELETATGVKSATGLADEFVVVQGMADLVVLLPEEIWLLDFKTDDLRRNELSARTKDYAPQLKLYARALEKIYARPVTFCWLHFLAARRTATI